MLMLLQVMDPCHANFTHHKVQGARSNEKGTDIKPLTPPTPAGASLVPRLHVLVPASDCCVSICTPSTPRLPHWAVVRLLPVMEATQ